jgi:hypothetical protein
VLERLDPRTVALEEGGGEVLRRPRVDLSLDCPREHKHLERRSRLPLPVGCDVVGDLLSRLADRHGADLTRSRVDRDD